MAKATRKKAAKKATAENGTPERKQISGDALPRRSLEQSLEFPKLLRQIFAGKSATVDELAKAMEMSKTSDNFRFGLWSAVSYGVVNSERAKHESALFACRNW